MERQDQLLCAQVRRRISIFFFFLYTYTHTYADYKYISSPAVRQVAPLSVSHGLFSLYYIIRSQCTPKRLGIECGEAAAPAAGCSLESARREITAPTTMPQ